MRDSRYTGHLVTHPGHRKGLRTAASCYLLGPQGQHGQLLRSKPPNEHEKIMGRYFPIYFHAFSCAGRPKSLAGPAPRRPLLILTVDPRTREGCGVTLRVDTWIST
ncbi:hypothetical protein EVAR_40082_1 [Eumeta japonica]|uniref:Uncharacterized protein n=1 Tax=Eumeta variegata TaxID=151549 RepID=A0A4C1X5H0_EUMVA|nr:hypothetical protein EVAR_40082_1 [Eumeta japonica]